MSTVARYEWVVLEVDLPEQRLVAGDTGTIVSHAGDRVEVEFPRVLLGEPEVTALLDLGVLRRPAAGELSRVRPLAGGPWVGATSLDHFALHENVVLVTDQPAAGLCAGDLGSIVDATDPATRDVEFRDWAARVVARLRLRAEDIRLVEHSDLAATRRLR